LSVPLGVLTVGAAGAAEVVAAGVVEVGAAGAFEVGAAGVVEVGAAGVVEVVAQPARMERRSARMPIPIKHFLFIFPPLAILV
jgi:uncharacterized protein (DUF2345 family)